MKIPIKSNEIGLVKKGIFNNYIFTRLESWEYKSKKNGVPISFGDYVKLYPIEKGSIFYRQKQ